VLANSRSAEEAFARFVLREGLLPEELAQDLDTARRTGQCENVWTWLAAHCPAEEETLARAVATQLHLPYAPPGSLAPDLGAAAALPPEFISQTQLVPLAITQSTVRLALANPFAREAIDVVEQATQRYAQLVVASPTTIRDALWRLFAARSAIADCLAHVRELPATASAPSAKASKGATANLPPRRPEEQLIDAILHTAVGYRASEVHFEPRAEVVSVRAQIDGVFEELLRFPKWLEDPLVRNCKLLAGLDPEEHKTRQHGAVAVSIAQRSGTLEVESEPARFGEHVILRWRDAEQTAARLEELGLLPEELSELQEVLRAGRGLVLLAGAQHSGKEVTLKALAAHCAQTHGSVFYLGDPEVEGGVAPADPTKEHAQGGADPDEQPVPPVVVGSLTDTKTAELALHLAAGRLVFATLDSNDLVSAVAELISLTGSAQLVANGLALVVVQAALRKTCHFCRDLYEPERGLLVRLHLPAASACYLRGQGCVRCRKTGFSGRLVVFHLVRFTPGMREQLAHAHNEQELRCALQNARGPSLIERVAALVLEGETTVEEAYRVLALVPSSTRCPQCGSSCENETAEPFTCVHCGCRGTPDKFDTSTGAELCSLPSPGCGTVATPDPAVPTAASPAPAGPPRQMAPAGVRPPEFDVLVVEDEPDMRRLIERTLQRSGLPVRVRTAANGTQALQLVEASLPHLILLDVLMPGMDGLTVCERLRSSVRTSFLPILMLTALDGSEVRTRAFSAGIDDFLAKPFARDELVARVRRILQRTYGFVEVNLSSPRAAARPRATLRMAS